MAKNQNKNQKPKQNKKKINQAPSLRALMRKNKSKLINIYPTMKRTRPKITRKRLNRATNFRPGGRIDRDYIHCRLMPFSMSGGMGIPDGSETKRLVVDHRMVNTFTFGTSGTINIAITPTLPNSIWVNTGSISDLTWLLNGTTHPFNSATSQVYVPICQPEWAALPMYRFASTGSIDTVQTLYNSANFRIVSVGWAITYIGSGIANSGVMIISNAKLSFGAPISNQGTLQIFSSQSGTNTNYTIGQTMSMILSQDLNFGVPNAYSAQIALLRGANGILKHSTSDYKYCPLYSNSTYATISDTSLLSVLQETNSSTLTCDGTGLVLGADSDWDTTLIKITGGSTGQSFTLDTIYCVEYVPSPGSSVYALTKSGPPESLPSIKMAHAAVNKLPIACEGGSASSTNWVSELMAGGAKMVGKSIVMGASAL